MRVFIVEDDPLLGEALATGLTQRRFEPDWVQDGREAQTALRVEPFAAINGPGDAALLAILFRNLSTVRLETSQTGVDDRSRLRSRVLPHECA